MQINQIYEKIELLTEVLKIKSIEKNLNLFIIFLFEHKFKFFLFKIGIF